MAEPFEIVKPDDIPDKWFHGVDIPKVRQNLINDINARLSERGRLVVPGNNSDIIGIGWFHCNAGSSSHLAANVEGLLFTRIKTEEPKCEHRPTMEINGISLTIDNPWDFCPLCGELT